MQQANAKVKPSKALTIEYVNLKGMELDRIKKHGPPRYNSEQLDEMINKRLDRGMKNGKMAANLSYQKVELKSDIGHLAKIIADAKDHKTREEASHQILVLESKLSKVMEALRLEKERESQYFDTRDEEGAQHKMSVMELEKKLAA